MFWKFIKFLGDYFLDEQGNRKWIHQDKQLIDNFVIYQAKVSCAYQCSYQQDIFDSNYWSLAFLCQKYTVF